MRKTTILLLGFLWLLVITQEALIYEMNKEINALTEQSHRADAYLPGEPTQ